MYRRLTAASRALSRSSPGLTMPSVRSFNSATSLSRPHGTPLVLQRDRGAVRYTAHYPALTCGGSSSTQRRFFVLPTWTTGMTEETSASKEKATAATSTAKTGATASPSSPDSSAKAATVSAAASSHLEEQSKLEKQLTELRELYLEPYDKMYHFLNPMRSTMPMVMMLGNHSSGKSTLINYLAGREIQETGIAPTDDGFTVIKRDVFDMDADGPSMVSNVKYQYQSLRQFGISFVTHFKMKTRKMADTSRISMNMVLVDTPGMIDTPLHGRTGGDSINDAALSSSFALRSANEVLCGNDQTRGYDFLGVTRWFAQQSDVILLLFDPANPGTTGETLDVLTKSLAGFEHKFLLLLNKADSFEKVTDFGRAYGTLCWNLSKVMKMKDIPRVYTTCTPLPKNEKAAKASNGILPAEELSRQRNEVLSEIMSAPIRRMDNLITETEDSARNLLLAMRAAKVLRGDYRQRELAVYSALATACLIGPAAAVMLSSVSLTSTIVLTLLSVAVAGVGLVAAQTYLKEFERGILESSDYVLNRLFNEKTRTKDIEQRWHRVVKPEIIRVMTTYHDSGASGIMTLPTCSARACRGMEALVSVEIPLLRQSLTDYKESYFRGKSKADSKSV